MIFNPLTLISIMISSLMAFAVVAIAIEMTIFGFKIQKGRVRSLLRLLPLASLIIDLVAGTFSVGYWFNPLNCSSCMQKMVLSLFFPNLKAYLDLNQISLFNFLAKDFSHPAIMAVYALFFATTLFFAVRAILKGILLTGALRSLEQSTHVCTRRIENQLLKDALRRSHVIILTSNHIKIPMVTYSKKIFMPKEIVEKYPQDEFEAILAHELEHVLWKDPMIRPCVELIKSIFWWVPMNSWKKQLELDQEIACDQSVLKYGTDEKPLASALFKVASVAKHESALCYLTSDKHPLLHRLQAILDPVAIRYFDVKSLSIIVSSALVLLACAFWF